MCFINYSSREINCKIVYYGPGLCGKTTNLQYIYAKTNPEAKGKMISLATETERTLFFDFLPLSLGEIRGFKTRFHLYTVPGQVFYDASRKLILQGRRRRGLRRRLPDRAHGGEHRDRSRTCASTCRSRATTSTRSRTSSSTTSATCRTSRPSRSCTGCSTRRRCPTSRPSRATGVGVFDTLKAVAKLVLTELKKGG